jgi:F-type H+-transporting ATPase subunit gamma
MATARELRTRIRTVKNIKKITQAMKMVAAARLNRAQQRVQAARPYAEMMQQVMQQLSTAVENVEHPLLEVREERNIAAVVLTSDKGLCGSYNTNILRKAMELLRPRDPATVKLVLMGRKGIGFFRRQRYPIVTQLPLNASDVRFTDVEPIVEAVRRMFEAEEVDAVYVVYSRYINPMSQVPTILPLLPLKPEAVGAQPSAISASAPAPTSTAGAASARPVPGQASTLTADGRQLTTTGDFLFEPSADEILARLLPRYVNTQVYRALVEAVASEHGARTTSMSAATQNAGDMIDTLTLSLNRARQAAITKEIAEIVGGAEALK